MSGYLYANKSISNTFQWIRNNMIKICKPYWLYLIVIFPVIAVLNPSELSWMKVFASFTCIQGFGGIFTITGLGQRWFVSYILLCYILLGVVLNKLEFSKVESEKRGAG